jgi:hypothetical protein
MIGVALALHEFLSDQDQDGSVDELGRSARRPTESNFDEGDHFGERGPTLQQNHCPSPLCQNEANGFQWMTFYSTLVMYTYIT